MQMRIMRARSSMDMDNNDHQHTLHAVSDEVMLAVLSWLPVSALSASSRVSRNWRRLANDDSLWLDEFTRRWHHTPQNPPADNKRILTKSLYARKHKIERNWTDANTAPTATHHSTNNNNYNNNSNDNKSSDKVSQRAVKTLAVSGHNSSVTTVKINSALGKILSGSRDKTIKIWDLQSKKCVHTVKGFRGTVESLQFDERRHVSANLHKDVWVFDMNTQEKIAKLRHPNSVYTVFYQGETVIAGGVDKLVRVFDLRTSKCVRTFAGHTDSVSDIQSDGQKVWSASVDGTVREWQLAAPSSPPHVYNHYKAIRSLLLRGNTLYTGGENRELKEWNTADHTLMSSKPSKNYIVSIAMSEYGLLTNNDEGVRVHPFASAIQPFDLPPIRPPNVPYCWATGIDVDQEGRYVVGAGAAQSGHIMLWDFLC